MLAVSDPPSPYASRNAVIILMTCVLFAGCDGAAEASPPNGPGAIPSEEVCATVQKPETAITVACRIRRITAAGSTPKVPSWSEAYHLALLFRTARDAQMNAREPEDGPLIAAFAELNSYSVMVTGVAWLELISIQPRVLPDAAHEAPAD